MKYINAFSVLPDYLVEELQKHVQSSYIYVPSKKGQRKNWGELSGYREKIEKRNDKIRQDFASGISIEMLADTYFLSEHTIKKIVYSR
ncbi:MULTISPECIES: CD3324 family protein [Eubacteriales]|uniref:CD3324 family protein n=1 Tax=Eubacteriales TaxID=186802 RepID=UPI00289B6CEB|nr:MULTISPECIES: CD3324 family protein [Eubacteriales]